MLGDSYRPVQGQYSHGMIGQDFSVRDVPNSTNLA